MPGRNRQAVSRGDIQPLLGSRLLWRGLAFIALIVIVFWVLNVMQNKTLFPIQTIRAQGSFVHVTEEMLQQVIKNADDKGFFTIDVTKIQKQVESLPWVKQASVKRIWPGTLTIAVTERHPVARLEQDGLVDSEGEIFFPEKATYPENLVTFDVANAQVKLCLNYYYDSIAMLNKIGLEVNHVTYTDRHALSFRLNNKFNLILGRENKLYRLNRFARIYRNNLHTDNEKISSIDMGYTNGLSVEWEVGHTPVSQPGVKNKAVAQNNSEPGHV